MDDTNLAKLYATRAQYLAEHREAKKYGSKEDIEPFRDLTEKVSSAIYKEEFTRAKRLELVPERELNSIEDPARIKQRLKNLEIENLKELYGINPDPYLGADHLEEKYAEARELIKEEKWEAAHDVLYNAMLEELHIQDGRTLEEHNAWRDSLQREMKCLERRLNPFD